MSEPIIDRELTYWVTPGEENFACATALVLSRFTRGARWEYAHPGLVTVIVSTRGVERIKKFFRSVGKELIAENNAPERFP